ncbi:hypothetical protein [Actinoplanes sp. NPDC051851]|uniref:hypothetical protein n=1 Tax=Actinoplanes sp. NPDC051851 TaxID=3154753 RepID=UPI00343FD579
MPGIPLGYSPAWLARTMRDERHLLRDLTRANLNLGVVFEQPQASSHRPGTSPLAQMYQWATSNQDYSLIERLTLDKAGGSGRHLYRAQEFLEGVCAQGTNVYEYIRQVRGTADRMTTSEHFATTLRLLDDDRDIHRGKLFQALRAKLTADDKHPAQAAAEAKIVAERLFGHHQASRDKPWVRELDRQYDKQTRAVQSSTRASAALQPSSVATSAAPAPAPGEIPPTYSWSSNQMGLGR